MDFEYLNHRMIEERQRAADADNESARQAHLELAEHYRARIERLRGEDEGPELRIAGNS